MARTSVRPEGMSAPVSKKPSSSTGQLAVEPAGAGLAPMKTKRPQMDWVEVAPRTGCHEFDGLEDRCRRAEPTTSVWGETLISEFARFGRSDSATSSC